MYSVVVSNAYVLNPTIVINLNQDTLRENMGTRLDHLLPVNVLNANVSDKALTQYAELLSSKSNNTEAFKLFDCGRHTQ